MPATKPPPYSKRDVVAEAINKGKKIQGLKGFVPAEMKCCCGNTKVYLPVKVVGIKLEGCSASLECALTTTDDTIQIKDTFDVKTDDFFPTAGDVSNWEDFLKRKHSFDKEARILQYGGSAYNKKKLFNDLLDSGSLDLNPDIKLEVDAAVEEAGGLSKLSTGTRDDLSRKMLVRKYFPNHEEGFDPDNVYDD